MNDLEVLVRFCSDKRDDRSLGMDEREKYMDIACYLSEYRVLHRMLKDLGRSLPEIEFERRANSVRVAGKG